MIVELAVDPTVPAEERVADLQARFAQLGAEMTTVNEQFDDDQLAAIAQWLRLGNDALERSIERMRQRD